MKNTAKKEILNLCRQIEVKEAYCKHCSYAEICYLEGEFGAYDERNAECKAGLKYADKKELKKDLFKAQNYVPGNIHLF